MGVSETRRPVEAFIGPGSGGLHLPPGSEGRRARPLHPGPSSRTHRLLCELMLEADFAKTYSLDIHGRLHSSEAAALNVKGV